MQGLFPCGRRMRLPPSGGSRMRILRLALLLALAFPRRRDWRRTRRSSSRDVPLAGERALASSKRARPLQPRRAALARPRLGAVPDALARRPVERLGGRGARGRGPAGLAARAERGSRGLVAARQPVVGRPVESDRVPAARQGDEAARVLRLEPDARGARRARSRPPARPRSCRGAAGTRTRRSGAAGPSFAPDSPARARAPHGGRERLHAPPSRRRSCGRSSSTT